MLDESNPKYASEWPEEDRHRLFLDREAILVQLHENDGVLDIEAVRTNTYGTIALLTLIDEQRVAINPNNPIQLRLIEDRQRQVIGSTALRHN